jgi:nicotinamide riboside kinase
MELKISISGTFSSGKTTLSNELISRIPNSILIPEHAWNIKLLFPHIDWTNQIVRDYMLFSQLVREANIRNTENLIICDSGIIESLAHSLVFEVAPHFELIEKLTHKKYDLVFICDHTTVPIVDNNVRETDPTLRTKLHQTIMNIAIHLGYNPVILKGDVEERTSSVMKFLKSTKSL